MDRPLVGVSLIIKRDNEILLHLRKGKHAPDLWGCAGGHQEFFESFEQTVYRELLEEAGPDIKIFQPKFLYTANTLFPEEQKHYVVVFMLSQWLEGEPKIMEPEKCAEWKWFDLSQLPNNLMPGIKILKENNIL